ncbi:CPBP family intramembrane glutamic endopeptidase [Actinoplanes sp. NPDC049265]|uniref:CPBP family intramembrane glutamic endopeptidase n=1 Tax=Actinoplanes sp. NPDC049265 TaxID=3363902 RepID=UPI003718BCEF
MALTLFLSVVTILAVLWGRTNRLGYSRFITSPARVIMTYSRMTDELIRSCLVWCLYLSVGLLGAVALLVAYRINLLNHLTVSQGQAWVIPVAFIAQNALTGLMMQLWLVARPGSDIFADLVGILWVRYTLMMPRLMRVAAPLGAAVVEEVFFRGAVFLILLTRFPGIGAYWAIVVCTALFVVQQILQTDTTGQRVIFLVGSTSISIVGCLTMLYTGSFLPTLVCHAAYAAVYLQLGTTLPKWQVRRAGTKARAGNSSF